MATTPLATKADVQERLRRDLTSAEAGENDKWINGILKEASLLVTSYCGQSFDAPIPDEVVMVTSRVAARGVTNTRTDSAQSQADEADIWRRTITFQADSTTGGIWLTKADKQMLSPYVIGGQVFSVDMA